MHKENYFIQCPFYKKHDTLNIRCEGTEDNNRLVHQFHKGIDTKDYMTRYCENDNFYKTCRLYKMLDAKYD